MSEDKNYYDLFVPENILTTRCRREFKTLIFFNSWKGNVVDIDRNFIFFPMKRHRELLIDFEKGQAF